MTFVAHNHPAISAFTPITDGLVWWAEMEEGSGTAVGDSSGNNIDGAFDTGTPVWVQGWKAGRFGLQYDGASNVRHYNNETIHTALQQIGNNNNYTVMGRFKTTAHSGENFFWRPDGVLIDLRKLTSTSTQYKTPLCIGVTNSRLWFSRANGGAYTSGLNANTIVNDGAWHHGAVRITNNYAEAFVDGSPDGNFTFTGQGASPCHVGVTLSVAGFGAGFNNTNVASQLFIGDTDDFRVYDRALTDQEIATIAAGNG